MIGTWMRGLAAAGMVAVLTGAALAAGHEVDPTGRWQTTSGESRYDFTYCGADDAQLCARLVWLNADATKVAGNELGNYAVRQAAHTAANTWKGVLHYQGKSANSTIVLTGPKSLTISGCYLIFCRSFDLVKISDQVGSVADAN